MSPVIAEVTPRGEPSWVAAEDVDAVLRELGGDDAWAQELAADRAAVEVSDPWVRVG